MTTSTSFACFSILTGTRPKTPTLHQIRAAIATVALLILTSQSAKAEVTEMWAHHLSNVVSNSVDRPQKVVNDAAGNIIVTGISNDNESGPDLLTIKYSRTDGSMLWQQRHRYHPSTYALAYPSAVAVAVAVDRSGNVVVTGSTVDTDNDNESDYYTAKYAAATGEVLWEKRLHIPGDDHPTAVAVDGSGNVVVTGSTATLKYAAEDGALLWEKRNDGPGKENVFDYARALALDGNGNVVVTGVSFSPAANSYYTAKYASNDGALLWEQRHHNSPEEFSSAAVAVDGGGNVVVTDSTATLKYAAEDGALLWEKRNDAPGIGYSSVAVAVDASGNAVVTGNSQNAQGDPDYYTVKYAAADGALLWERRYDGPAISSWDYAQAMAIDGSGNVVVTGISSDGEVFPGWFGSSFDYCTVKYAAADGVSLWERRYKSREPFGPGSDFGLPAVAALTVDGTGNVIVTGPSLREPVYRLPVTEEYYYTAKYAEVDGALLWEKSHSGPAHHDSNPSEVVMDRNGNVVLTATSEDDYYVARYAGADGALLWEKRGPGQVTHVAVNNNGAVLITGLSYDSSGGENPYYTAKYAANGALLWERRGPGGGAQAVLDANGNVLVTGGTSDGGSNSDYYTAKYAASDGALLWEKRYSGPGFDTAYAIGVDSLGNVAVTGISYAGVPPTRNYDYYTAKYAAADGALLWEKRYTGSEDAGWAVAMDSSGNVMVTGLNATLKYAAADGALLWVKHYNGTRALAMDDLGNVVLIGPSGTLKLAAADGALLWHKSLVNGAAFAVAVDDSGNVVVTGDSYQKNTSLYTAKYAAADGSLLWEKRYNEGVGFSNGAGGPHCLALGPNGLVAIAGSSVLSTTGAGDLLTIVYREGLPPIAVEIVPDGVRLNFTGTAGQSYTLQRAATLAGPWKTINTKTAPTSGFIEFQEQIQPPETAFYRMRQP